MTYYYSYSINDNGTVRHGNKQFDSREAMDQYIKEHNLPNPGNVFTSLPDFFGTHRHFMNYLHDVFPRLAYTTPENKLGESITNSRFNFDEYDQRAKKLGDTEAQKQQLQEDIAKLREYETVFKKHNHKEMLKKVQADITDAQKALDALS